MIAMDTVAMIRTLNFWALQLSFYVGQEPFLSQQIINLSVKVKWLGATLTDVFNRLRRLRCLV